MMFKREYNYFVWCDFQSLAQNSEFGLEKEVYLNNG